MLIKSKVLPISHTATIVIVIKIGLNSIDHEKIFDTGNDISCMLDNTEYSKVELD